MSPWQLRRVSQVIRQGGIVAYPTEAVYGLGCDPFSFSAIMRLLDIKQRTIKKGLILVASSIQQIEPLCAPLPPELSRQLHLAWPGPITWLIPAAQDVPGWLTGNGKKIAVRVSAHPVIQGICQQLQHPIISTSANISHCPPARSAIQVRKFFGDNLDMILTGPSSGLKKPTRIIDSTTGIILRT